MNFLKSKWYRMRWQGWADRDQYEAILDDAKTAPDFSDEPALMLLYGRALAETAMMHQRDDPVTRERAGRAIDVLLSIGSTFGETAEWNKAMAYAYFTLENLMETAATYALKWQELAPRDPAAKAMVDTCHEFFRRNDPESMDLILYRPQDQWAVEDFIGEYFGDIEWTMEEIHSYGIRVDVAVIPPDEESRPFYTLVTIGMGAYSMHVPQDLAEQKLARAELVIALPPYWDIQNEDEKWYWPVRLLKSIARMPAANEAWLAWGHTIELNPPTGYENPTQFKAAILVDPLIGKDAPPVCPLPDGDEVNFYHVIPLYQEEMVYKLQNGADALLAKIPTFRGAIISPDRPNAITQPELMNSDLPDDLMDAIPFHLKLIKELRLSVEDLAAASHMAIFLRWAILHNLMSDEFAAKHPDLITRVKSNDKRLDLRLFLWKDEELEQQLTQSLFNGYGIGFADWYYGPAGPKEHSYTVDVDAFAQTYFGKDQYNSPKFKGHAYLFIPWTEAYYWKMARIIDRRFGEWQSLFFEEHSKEKKFALPREMISDRLPDWTGPRGCYVSDRIMVDGLAVGFCRRDAPDDETPPWDSGWSFFAGDESDEYLKNPNCFGIYDINTLANFDPAVISILTTKGPCMFERTKDRKLIRIG